MELFEKLPSSEVELLRQYINRFGGSGESESFMSVEGMPYFLRFWDANKAHLYKMFGEQFILRKEISFAKDADILEEEMEHAIRHRDSLVSDFRSTYVRRIDNILDLAYDIKYELRRFATDYSMLVQNEYNGEPFTIPARLTVDKHPLQINKGVKAVKMLGKICQALGIQLTMYKCPHCGTYFENESDKCWCGADEPRVKCDGYETFRRAHSLVLNQKKLKGNLCLSIHPLDYLTISDNASGWGSCMTWMDDPGDYRLGTLEMMNSKYIVVAYVEGKEPMEFGCDLYWNNKRWRQLIVVTPEMILGNKQYPYFNDDLQGTALMWMRELASGKLGHGPYESEALQIVNQTSNVVGKRKIRVSFTFDYMYNDIYDHRMAYIASNFDGDYISYNLSGPAVCTNCGEEIGWANGDSDVEPSWTVCRECSGMWKCNSCGDWHYGEPYYPEDSDYPLCGYCYNNDTEECEVCGDRVLETASVYIEVLPNAKEEDESYNWNFVIDACHNCLHHNPEFKELFGETVVREDMYGRSRQVVLLENISEEGWTRGSLDPYTREILQSLQTCNSYEERVELLRKNLY